MKIKLSENLQKNNLIGQNAKLIITLANLISACSKLKIDTCPMEGFESEQYNTFLGLTEKGLNASVIVPIENRHKEDEIQHLPKVRKPLKTLFEKL